MATFWVPSKLVRYSRMSVLNKNYGIFKNKVLLILNTKNFLLSYSKEYFKQEVQR